MTAPDASEPAPEHTPGPSKEGETRPSLRQGGEVGYGSMTFDDGVIADLARRAALGMEGVSALTGTFLGGLRPGRHGGVTVTQREEGVAIEIRVAVAYGTDCVKLFDDLRARVASRVAESTGQEVSELNLRVTGIREPDADDDHDEPSYIDF